MSQKYRIALLAASVAFVVGAAVAASASTGADPDAAPEDDSAAVETRPTTPPAATTVETPDSASPTEAPSVDPAAEVSTNRDIEPVSLDAKLAVLEAPANQKLIATGVDHRGADWWVTTWSDEVHAGATVFCIGSPSGAACHDDAHLPSAAPVIVKTIGGWPPEFSLLVEPSADVAAITLGGRSVDFDQVSLDIPSARSLVALPLPLEPVDIVVTFENDGESNELQVSYEPEFSAEDVEALVAAASVVAEYAPTPGLALGERSQ